MNFVRFCIFVLSLYAVFSPSQPRAQNSEQDGFLWHGDLDDPRTFVREWYTSDFAIKFEWFRTKWSQRRRELDGNSITLHLTPNMRPSVAKDFLGAEVQHRTVTQYGRYEVVMTPARGEGVISSFFTYTGPSFGQPHDEIDIEFLGRDTTKLWAMAFSKGQKLPNQWIDLGFDAADGPNLYAFDWQENFIAWYVNGTEIYRVTSDEADLPVTPGKLYINIWAGGKNQQNWSGEAPMDTVAAATYYCLSHQPNGADRRQCSDIFSFE